MDAPSDTRDGGETLPRLRPLEILKLPEDEGTASYLLRDPEGYSDEELVLSEAALFVAAHADGNHTLNELRTNFARRYGSVLEAEQARGVLSRLDAARMLENEAFFGTKERVDEAFLAAPVRPPAHAGVSYPADPEEARRTVARFFEEAAALEEDGERPPGNLRGLVAPHIDLRVGGAATALAYRMLEEAPAVETVVVLGTAHACPHPSWIVSDKPFETPLGIVPADAEGVRVLAGAAASPPDDVRFHRREHSIEFQALFLAALRARGRDLRLVPVLCGSLRGSGGEPGPDDSFLEALRTYLDRRGERAVVLAAADLAHVGIRFGDPEALGPPHLALLETRDRETLERVAAGDATGFAASVLDAGDPRRICGLSPIFGLLASLPGARGKLLRYEQAEDPTGVVTYASAGLWG